MKFNRKYITTLILGATLAPLTIVLLAGCSGGGNPNEGVDKNDTVVNRKEVGVTSKGKQLKAKGESQ